MPAPMAPLPMTATILLFANALISVSLELRCALFHEGGHAFAVIVAVTEIAHHARFQRQLLRQGIGTAGGQRLLGIGQAPGRCRGKVHGQLARFFGQLRVVHAFPDQAPVLGLSAVSFSPSMARPMARAEPIKRGRKKVPPVSGIRPSLQNTSTKLADLPAMTMSQASARLAPAPAATPLTAQITGMAKAFSANTSGA